jgi:hypothetical protein
VRGERAGRSAVPDKAKKRAVSMESADRWGIEPSIDLIKRRTAPHKNSVSKDLQFQADLFELFLCVLVSQHTLQLSELNNGDCDDRYRHGGTGHHRTNPRSHES